VAVKAFPNARISWSIDPRRQEIVDSWPADVNDEAARRDWGFSPRYDFDSAFEKYLIPRIKNRHG
jgi:nucleoside-diphosphate-sugar epimerase